MKFEEALKVMKSGIKVKLPSWGGYWYWNPKKRNHHYAYQRRE